MLLTEYPCSNTYNSNQTQGYTRFHRKPQVNQAIYQTKKIKKIEQEKLNEYLSKYYREKKYQGILDPSSPNNKNIFIDTDSEQQYNTKGQKEKYNKKSTTLLIAKSESQFPQTYNSQNVFTGNRNNPIKTIYKKNYYTYNPLNGELYQVKNTPTSSKVNNNEQRYHKNNNNNYEYKTYNNFNDEYLNNNIFLKNQNFPDYNQKNLNNNKVETKKYPVGIIYTKKPKKYMKDSVKSTVTDNENLTSKYDNSSYIATPMGKMKVNYARINEEDYPQQEFEQPIQTQLYNYNNDNYYQVSPLFYESNSHDKGGKINLSYRFNNNGNSDENRYNNYYIKNRKQKELLIKLQRYIKAFLLRNFCATKIQSVWRGRNTRKIMELYHDLDEFIFRLSIVQFNHFNNNFCFFIKQLFKIYKSKISNENYLLENYNENNSSNNPDENYLGQISPDDLDRKGSMNENEDIYNKNSYSVPFDSGKNSNRISHNLKSKGEISSRTKKSNEKPKKLVKTGKKESDTISKDYEADLDINREDDSFNREVSEDGKDNNGSLIKDKRYSYYSIHSDENSKYFDNENPKEKETNKLCISKNSGGSKVNNSANYTGCSSRQGNSKLLKFNTNESPSFEKSKNYIGHLSKTFQRRNNENEYLNNNLITPKHEEDFIILNKFYTPKENIDTNISRQKTGISTNCKKIPIKNWNDLNKSIKNEEILILQNFQNDKNIKINSVDELYIEHENMINIKKDKKYKKILKDMMKEKDDEISSLKMELEKMLQKMNEPKIFKNKNLSIHNNLVNIEGIKPQKIELNINKEISHYFLNNEESQKVKELKNKLNDLLSEKNKKEKEWQNLSMDKFDAVEFKHMKIPVQFKNITNIRLAYNKAHFVKKFKHLKTMPNNKIFISSINKKYIDEETNTCVDEKKTINLISYENQLFVKKTKELKELKDEMINTDDIPKKEIKLNVDNCIELNIDKIYDNKENRLKELNVSKEEINLIGKKPQLILEQIPQENNRFTVETINKDKGIYDNEALKQIDNCINIDINRSYEKIKELKDKNQFAVKKIHSIIYKCKEKDKLKNSKNHQMEKLLSSPQPNLSFTLNPQNKKKNSKIRNNQFI